MAIGDFRKGASKGIIFADGIRAAAGRSPNKTALQLGEDTVTSGQLIERIDRFSNVISAGLKIAPGERIGIIAVNRIEYVEVVCGTAAAGAICTTIGPVASASEIAFIVDDADIKALFIDPELEDLVRAAVGDRVRHIIPFGPAYEDLLSRASDSVNATSIDDADVFLIHYTSGSTGRPKGVLLSHRARVRAAFATAAEHGCYTPDDRAIAITPLFHGAGLLATLTPLFFGGSIRLIRKFDIEHLLGAIESFAATSAYMIPAHFAALIEMGDAARKYSMASLKAVMSGTSPLGQSAKASVIEYFGEGRLNERYGSTEGGVITCLRPQYQLTKRECVGQPLPLTHIRVTRPNGEPAAPGEAGELAVTSPYLFSGYLNLPEETARVTRGEWYVSGDIGQIDEEGFLYLVGRKNDMIISGGENIYPIEVERVLGTHPAVESSAVIGVPHDYWGEAVVAHVVLRDGMSATAEELLDLCKQALSRYKAPKEIRFVPDLPRTALGKIIRGRLPRDPAQ